MENNEEIKQKIETAIHSLLKYAHHPNCTAINSCPSTHDKCSKRLNLDTAIAFEMANELQMLLPYLNDTSTYHHTTLRGWVLKKLERGFTMADAFELVLAKHKQRYPELFVYIRDIADLLDDRITTLQES